MQLHNRIAGALLVLVGLAGSIIALLALLELFHPFIGTTISYRWPIPGYRDSKTLIARRAIDVTFLRDRVIQIVVGDAQALDELESDHLRPSESEVSDSHVAIVWGIRLNTWLAKMKCASPPDRLGSPKGGHGSYRQYISSIGACRYVKYVDMHGHVSAVRIWQQTLFPHFTRYI